MEGCRAGHLRMIGPRDAGHDRSSGILQNTGPLDLTLVAEQDGMQNPMREHALLDEPPRRGFCDILRNVRVIEPDAFDTGRSRRSQLPTDTALDIFQTRGSAIDDGLRQTICMFLRPR